MKIREFRINGHFRNLAHLKIDFSKSSNITAVVGENGSGKSSLLNAISLLVMDAIDSSLDFEGVFEDSNNETFIINMKNMKDIQNKKINILSFDSNRFSNSEEYLKLELTEQESKKLFFLVTKKLFAGLNKTLIKIDLDKNNQPVFITSYSKISLSKLGEGCRIFLSMILKLLSSLEKEREELPIVLIDELELHFYPKVHRILVSILKKCFPDIQFIIITNSPLVISELSNEEVRIIDSSNFNICSCAYHTFGSDVNTLLRLVFNSDERPSEIKRLFEEFSFEVANRNFTKAKDILSRLKFVLGENDSDIVSCTVTLDLEELDEKVFGDKHKKIKE